MGHSRRATATDGLSEKTGHEGKSELYRISTCSTPFSLFLASCRPGTHLKSFLEAIRFNYTACKPVATLKTSNRLNFHVFDRHFVRLAPQFQRFLLKNDFLTKEVTPLDPSHKIRIEIPHKTTCLPAPPLFSDLQWWLERSEQ